MEPQGVLLRIFLLLRILRLRGELLAAFTEIRVHGRGSSVVLCVESIAVAVVIVGIGVNKVLKLWLLLRLRGRRLEMLSVGLQVVLLLMLLLWMKLRVGARLRLQQLLRLLSGRCARRRGVRVVGRGASRVEGLRLLRLELLLRMRIALLRLRRESRLLQGLLRSARVVVTQRHFRSTAATGTAPPFALLAISRRRL